MNRRQLESHLREHGCVFDHHGGRHDVWINPITGAEAMMPWHRTLRRNTARAICKQLGVPKPPGL